jgi:TolB protein
MVDPPDFDDPGPLPIREPSRVRRVASITIVLLLVASMVFLAWVSGRGEVTVKPVAIPTAVATATIAHRLAVVDAAGHLTTMSADGGSVVTYGQAGVTYRFPTWSPDGTRVAAIATTPTGNAVHAFTVPRPGVGSSSSTVPTAIDQTTVYEAAAGGPFYVYWAPDSTALTFLTTEPGGIALRLGSADGTQPVRIVREAMPLYWAWSDGDRMLVHSGGDGPGAFLGEVTRDGSTAADLGVQPGDFRAPARSRDGRYRGYIVPATDAPEHVVVEGSDGSGRHEVPVLGGGVVGFGPDGDELAFIAPAKAGPPVTVPVGPLRVVDAVSGTVRTLQPGNVVAFFWSPNGRTIAAFRIGAPDDTVALARSTRPAAAAPGLALDLLFVDAASGSVRSRTPVRLADTFTAQVLPFFDQYALSHRLWAPDSSAIVVPLVAEDGTTGLSIIRPDGSGVRRIAAGDIGFWSP